MTSPRPMPGPDVLGVDDVDAIQRRYCARRNACLVTAAALGWRSLSCNGCDAYELLTGEDLRLERIGLLRITRVVVEMWNGERNSIGGVRRKRAA